MPPAEVIVQAIVTLLVAIVTGVVAVKTHRMDKAATLAASIVPDKSPSELLIETLQSQAAAAETRRDADLDHFGELIRVERGENARLRQRVLYLELVVRRLLQQIRSLGAEPVVLPNGSEYPDGFPERVE